MSSPVAAANARHRSSAVVLPQPMPYVLLGNTFLNRFQMQRTNDQLTLDKRF